MDAATVAILVVVVAATVAAMLATVAIIVAMAVATAAMAAAMVVDAVVVADAVVAPLTPLPRSRRRCRLKLPRSNFEQHGPQGPEVCCPNWLLPL